MEAEPCVTNWLRQIDASVYFFFFIATKKIQERLKTTEWNTGNKEVLSMRKGILIGGLLVESPEIGTACNILQPDSGVLS